MFDCSKKICEYRERKFLLLEELTKILGVNLVSISRWERVKFEPNMEIKKKLVTLFNEIGMKLND